LADIALRRPSLDEVFFALTGGNDEQKAASQPGLTEFGHESSEYESGGRHRREAAGTNGATRNDSKVLW
jgi:hypothetical protein